jgi:hypothetical protein
MSLSFLGGDPIARVTSGKYEASIIYKDPEKTQKDPHYSKIDLKANMLEPIFDPSRRSVWYVAGRSGSGKSTFAANLAMTFKKLHPKKPIYFVSRTDWMDDPAYKKLKPKQVKLDQSLVDNPILIEKDIEKGSLMIFDDIGTIHDKFIKEEVFHLIKDILEVGRKLQLSLILTSHLINPNEKAFGRVIFNELENLVVFPGGAGHHQISYATENYLGLTKKQTVEFLKQKSRWLLINNNAPAYVMTQHSVYLLDGV